jgi:hypothetical protein
MGRDLAPRLAARVQAAVATDVVELKIADGGGLDVRRPVYNGKAFCHVAFPKDRLAIATVRPNAFSASAGDGGAPRETLAFTPAPGDDRLVVQEIAKAGGEIKDVTEADIIISGGRALKNEDNFKLLRRRLSAAQPAGGPDGQDGDAAALRGLRDQRGDSASGRHARQQGDRRDQQRQGSADLQARGLRDRRRLVQNRAGDDGRGAEAERLGLELGNRKYEAGDRKLVNGLPGTPLPRF